MRHEQNANYGTFVPERSIRNSADTIQLSRIAVQDGLYKVQFATPLGQGAGVVALASGKLLGGDSSMSYVGTYVETGDNFRAEVNVGTHTPTPGMPSVFGIPNGQIVIEGKSVGDNASLKGSSPQAPGVAFSANLSRLPQ